MLLKKKLFLYTSSAQTTSSEHSIKRLFQKNRKRNLNDKLLQSQACLSSFLHAYVKLL